MVAFGGFFTGPSDKKGTMPGFAMNNETFLVRFEEIQIEKLNSESQVQHLKDKLESCYDWEQIMEVVLECLEFFYDEEYFHIDCQSRIREWLSEFEGFGLMFILLPEDFKKYLYYLYVLMRNKNMEENMIKTNLEMFYDLTDQYERETQGLPLSDLVPKVEARLLNIIGGPKVCERRKMLKIRFFGHRYTLVVNFTVEKKRLRRTLVEHAAEVVARMVTDTEELEIPETLKQVVDDKIIDAEWVASYWCSKYMYDEENAESNDKKTVAQVNLVPQVPMTKFYLQNFFRKPFSIPRAFGHLVIENLPAESPERLLVICLLRIFKGRF